MKKIVVYLMGIFILSGIQVFAASCAKEGQTYNNGMDAQGPFSCCSGLKGFTGWFVGGQYSPLCYKSTQGKPVCKNIGTVKGRYYTDGKLLKKDESCTITPATNTCAKEGENSNASLGPKYYKPCCSSLKSFNPRPDITIGGITKTSVGGGVICYNANKGDPVCKKEGTMKGRYYTDGKLLKKDEGCTIISTTETCAKEGETENQNLVPAKVCCGGLGKFEYRRPSASSTHMCYKVTKGTPQCKKVGTSNEGRYYPDGILLKKDNECAKWTLGSSSSSKGSGYIEGSLSYPSSGIPSNMEVCAEDVSTKKTICTSKQIKNSKYTYGVGYSLKVPVGNYNVFARLIGKTTKAYYSMFVTCGLAASCKSHSNITVVVAKDKTITNINPWDRYK